MGPDSGIASRTVLRTVLELQNQFILIDSDFTTVLETICLDKF